jgi:hypothetical protein
MRHVLRASRVRGFARGAPASGPLFASDWSTALGSTPNALTDGGRWTRLVECGGSYTSVLSVVEGAPLGWTLTPNVLRVTQRGPTFCGDVEVNSGSARPAPSQTHWGRFFFRNDETANGHWHPIRYNTTGTVQSVPWARFGGMSGVAVGPNTSRTGAGVSLPYPYNQWVPGASPGSGSVRLANATWYRYEWMKEYVSALAYRIYPRIYALAGGAPLYDYTSFYQNDNADGPSSHSLESWYAAGNTFGVTDADLARNFGIGNEGPGGSSDSNQSWYLGSVRISTGGWIGGGL